MTSPKTASKARQGLESLQSTAVFREHAAGDRVGDPAEAVELEIEEPRRIVEGTAADGGDDGSEGHYFG
jgi:hypothetical protein